MPLAKFFYGNTHKWYFRSAAAVIVATYVTFVAAHFDDKDRWIFYLIAFGAITAVYWLVYAPAKWIQKDNVRTPPYDPIQNRSRLMWPMDGGGYDHDDCMQHVDVQRILHGETVPDSPHIPVEVSVLHVYLIDDGTSVEDGQYMHTRQWVPPGFWRGSKECSTFCHAVTNEFSSKDLSLSNTVVRADHNQGQRRYQLDLLLKSILYLDAHSPKWRRMAQWWEAGGRIRIFLRHFRRLFRTMFEKGHKLVKSKP